MEKFWHAYAAITSACSAATTVRCAVRTVGPPLLLFAATTQPAAVVTYGVPCVSYLYYGASPGAHIMRAVVAWLMAPSSLAYILRW